MARPAGFEPTTPWFVAKYSIQLSYGRFVQSNYFQLVSATGRLYQIEAITGFELMFLLLYSMPSNCNRPSRFFYQSSQLLFAGAMIVYLAGLVKIKLHLSRFSATYLLPDPGLP